MKIIFIENIDPTQNNSGGIATYINKFSQYLNKCGIETILIGSSPNAYNKHLKIRIGHFLNITNKRVSHFKFIVNSFLNVRKVKLQSNDIIFGQRLDVILPYILFHRKNKSVCISHGNQSVAIKQKKGKIQGAIFDIFEKLTVRFVDLLLTVDRKTKDYFQHKYPKYYSKVYLIPIGVDISMFFPIDKTTCRKKFNLSKNDKIIMYIGRLDREKNLCFLIDSFRIVTNELNSVKLIIVGSGREEEEIKAYVKNSKTQNISFWGLFDNTLIPELINCADVGVLCSSFEGSPTIVKEFLSCNVPVVSTDVGDVKTVINRLSGCHVSSWDVDDFAEKVIKVLQSQKKFNYRNDLIDYDNKKIFSKTLSLIEKC